MPLPLQTLPSLPFSKQPLYFRSTLNHVVIPRFLLYTQMKETWEAGKRVQCLRDSQYSHHSTCRRWIIVSGYNIWGINSRWHHQMVLLIPLRQQNQPGHLQKGLAGWAAGCSQVSVLLFLCSGCFCPLGETSSHSGNPCLVSFLNCGVIPTKPFNLSLLQFLYH